jgi:hypothetical protein
MSSQNAIQLATAIQSKVGSSLISTQNLLPRGESAGVMTQAGASSLGVFLLKDIYNMQERTYESVERVGSILQSQLDLAEEVERRRRDQLAEELKEKNKLIGPTPATTDGAGDSEDIEKALDASRMSSLLTAGLTTALVSGQFLKEFGKNLGKKLLKGTMYAAIAGFIADPIINYVENEFDLDLTEGAKKELKLGMIGAAAGFGLAGIPGAIIGATAPMIGKVASYIAGNLNADQIKDKDFAGTAIAGAAAGYWTTGKLAGLMAMSKFGSVKTLGLALGATPVMIGVGAAVALGVGAAYLAKKIDEYQELTLDKLDKTTKKLDKEMGEWAAREEQGLFERFGINLGQLSAIGEAKVATQEAMEQLGQDKKKFMADTGTQTKLIALADTISGYSEDAIKTIMLDRNKAGNFFDTVEAIKGIAAKGGFGEASKDVFSKMSAFSDKVQSVAKAQVAIGETGGVTQLVAENQFGRGGDMIEKAAPLQLQVKDLLQKQANAQEALRLATLAREAEDEEQRKTFLGKLADLGFNTDLEKAEIQANRDLNNITRQLNRTQDTLSGLGVQFNFDELKELYQDDPDGLKLLIERSVASRGSAFLDAQKNQASEASIVTPIVIEGSQSQTNIGGKSETYVGKLNTRGDDFFDREAYRYGAV